MRESSGDLPLSMLGSSGLINKRYGYDPSDKLIKGSIYAKVLKIYPDKRTIDCVGLHRHKNNGVFSNVPLMAPMFTQSEGLHWLPTIDEIDPIKFQSNSEIGQDNKKTEALAILLFIDNDLSNPICIGFVSPGENEFSFAEEGVKIEKHSSGIYSRITKDGSFEFSFPDGTFIKVADPKKNSATLDLTPPSGILDKQRDKKTRPWKINQKPTNVVTIHHKTGTTISIDERGSIKIDSVKNLSISAQEEITILSRTKKGKINVNGIDLESHVHTYSTLVPGVGNLETSIPLGSKVP